MYGSTLDTTLTMLENGDVRYGESGEDSLNEYSALKLFLTSFAECTASSLSPLMRERMRKTVKSLRVDMHGDLREDHPKAFTHIDMRITLVSPDADEKTVARAMDSVETKLCPVWAMIRGNVEVESSFVIERE